MEPWEKGKSWPVLGACKHQGNRRMQKRRTVDDNCWWESHVYAMNCIAHLWPGSADMG